jgi:hypothetical protein
MRPAAVLSNSIIILVLLGLLVQGLMAVGGNEV